MSLIPLIVLLMALAAKEGEEEICRCTSPQCIQLGRVIQECLCLSDNLNPHTKFSLCCGGGNRRRLGDASAAVGHDSREYRDYVDHQCGDYEYESAIHVDGQHLYAVATPKEKAMAAGCPMQSFVTRQPPSNC